MNSDYTYKKDLVRMEYIDISLGSYHVTHLTTEEWRRSMGIDRGQWDEVARSQYEDYMASWDLAIVEPEDIDLWYIDNLNHVVIRIRPWPDQVSTLVDTSDLLETLERKVREWKLKAQTARMAREKREQIRQEILEDEWREELDRKEIRRMREEGEDNE